MSPKGCRGVLHNGKLGVGGVWCGVALHVVGWRVVVLVVNKVWCVGSVLKFALQARS